MEMSVGKLQKRQSLNFLMKCITYISICFIFTIFIQGSCGVDEKYLIQYNDTVDYSPLVFQNFDEILKFLLQEEYRNLPHVKHAISIFREECTRYRVRPPMSGRRKPFIAIEAVHRPTRRSLARRLATLLRGTMLQNPPKCLMNLKMSFDSGPLKRAFHALSIYASGFIARRIVSHYPIIMNGYWYDQLSFSVARTFQNYSLPPDGSMIYDWPRDLVPPDIIFHVVNEENLYERYPPGGTRPPHDIMVRMLEVSRRVKGVPVVELNTLVSYAYTVNQMKDVLERNFSNVFDFFFNDYV